MKARHEFTTDKDYNEYVRTFIAAMAMQGILANTDSTDVWGSMKNVAEQGVIAADELLSQLTKVNTP